MKRLIIICEGETEQEFCARLLREHLLHFNIYIELPTTKKSGGGYVSWGTLYNQIITTLKNDTNAYVTTFIDLYGLHRPDLFPDWSESLIVASNPYERIRILEEGMLKVIPESFNYRFLPNIVLHEFEGLLFNQISYFDQLFEIDEYKNRQELIHILEKYPNPELINEGKDTSPSHRLNRFIFYSFQKTVHGILLAESIGLEAIRAKAPHFNQWITRLENL